MLKQRNRTGAVCTAMLAVALATLGLAGSASATLTGEFTKFQNCPWTNPEVERCTYAVTTGGEVVLGKKAVPIVKPVVVQGGYGAPVEEFSTFFAPTKGEALSKAAQPVPGGLLGLVPPAGSPPIVKALVELAAKNGLTGVNSTLELAGSPSKIIISEIHLAEEEGVALILPVKVHLENPFLGESCYIGSNGSPIIWQLQINKTKPPAPNEPIKGKGGVTNFYEAGQIVELEGTVLVDNAWSAPSPTGCGGALAFLVDPIIEAQLGSTTAGHNAAILENDISASPALAVKINDEEH